MYLGNYFLNFFDLVNENVKHKKNKEVKKVRGRKNIGTYFKKFKYDIYDYIIKKYTPVQYDA